MFTEIINYFGQQYGGFESKKGKPQQSNQAITGWGHNAARDEALQERVDELSNICVFEKIRNLNEGGGLKTIVHENFKPVLIPMENSSRGGDNILVVQCNIGKIRIRFINAYGVQETASAEERSNFYTILEQEIQFCINNGVLLCLELDANAKVGDMIVNNPQVTVSPNGRILINIIERNNLILVNGTEKCTGIITRQKLKNRI